MEVSYMIEIIKATNKKEFMALEEKLRKTVTAREAEEVLRIALLKKKLGGITHIVFHRLMDEALHTNCEFMHSKHELNEELNRLKERPEQVLVISF